MEKTKCYYPECMLCCCEEGKHCPQAMQKHISPVKQLLKGIAVGLLLTVLLIGVVVLLVNIWPTHQADIVACALLALLLTLLWLWNK